MKAFFVFNDGDHSVGLWETEGTFEFNENMIDTPQERKEMRERIVKMVEDFFDQEGASVLFDDECPDCGSRLIRMLTKFGECSNKDCIQNCNEARIARRRDNREKLDDMGISATSGYPGLEED